MAQQLKSLLILAFPGTCWIPSTHMATDKNGTLFLTSLASVDNILI